MKNIIKTIAFALSVSFVVSCGNDRDDQNTRASTFYSADRIDNGLKITTSKPVAFINIMGIQGGDTVSINRLVATIDHTRKEIEVSGLESNQGSLNMKIIYQDGGTDVVDLAEYK